MYICLTDNFILNDKGADTVGFLQKKFKEQAEAAEYAEKVGGVLITPYIVEFEAEITMSHAVYRVKNDMYAIYVRIHCKNGYAISRIVYRKTSKETYTAARELIEHLKMGEL